MNAVAVADADRVVVVDEFREFGRKLCAWPKPDVGHYTCVGYVVSTSFVVCRLSSLSAGFVVSDVTQMSEMGFLKVWQQGGVKVALPPKFPAVTAPIQTTCGYVTGGTCYVGPAVVSTQLDGVRDAPHITIRACYVVVI